MKLIYTIFVLFALTACGGGDLADLIGSIPTQGGTTTGNTPQAGTGTGNTPQAGTGTGNTPQAGTSTGNTQQTQRGPGYGKQANQALTAIASASSQNLIRHGFSTATAASCRTTTAALARGCTGNTHRFSWPTHEQAVRDANQPHHDHDTFPWITSTNRRTPGATGLAGDFTGNDHSGAYGEWMYFSVHRNNDTINAGSLPAPNFAGGGIQNSVVVSTHANGVRSNGYPTSLPKTASYTGFTRAIRTEVNDSNSQTPIATYPLVGDAKVMADFTSNTVSVSLTNFKGGDAPELANGLHFSNRIINKSTGGFGDIGGGRLRGGDRPKIGASFFGPNWQEVAGVYIWSNVELEEIPDKIDLSRGVRIDGAFGAKRD